MSRTYPSSPARWVVLAALAEASAPLDRRSLAEQTGIALASVRDNMLRPARAGWVTITRTPNKCVNGYKYLYEITALGREQLADHLKETTS